MMTRIIYSKRKSISLVVTRNAEVVVRAPLRTPVGFVENFVRQKHDWIQKALLRNQVPKKNFSAGELFLYLGAAYPLVVVSEFRSRIVFDNTFYISQHKIASVKNLLLKCYKEQAQTVLLERTKYFSSIMNLSYKHVSVKDMNTRWGSCSNRGNLNFSYRLIMAPPEVLDYVVVHELSHLVHHNHSQKFWNLVEQYCPSWKIHRNWLHANGNTLAL